MYVIAAASFLCISLGAIEGIFEIPLTITEPSGIQREDWPVTSGIPIPRGRLTDDSRVALFTASDVRVPLQTTVLSRWSDGSIKWLLLDFQIDLLPSETKAFVLKENAEIRNLDDISSVTLVDDGCTVTIHTGPLKFKLSRDRFHLFEAVALDRNRDGLLSDEELVADSTFNSGFELTSVDGTIYRTDDVPVAITVEDAGPMRASVRIEGRHRAGESSLFKYVIRLHAYAGLPFVKCHYTFINDHPVDLMTDIESIELIARHDVTDAAQYIVAGQPSKTFGDNAIRLFQNDDRSYNLNGTNHAGHALGWGAIAGDRDGVALGLRQFWQNWPKGVTAKENELRLGICPDFAAGMYDGHPLTEECKLYYYLRNGRYSFKVGVSRTHEVTALFFDGKPDIPQLTNFYRAAEQPLIAQFTTKYLAETNAKGKLPPANHHKYVGYDAWMDQFFDFHLQDREKVREFGMLNFGDWYNTNWDSWGNLEYDTARIWFTHYLRSGNRRYYDRAEQAARHYLDVDVLHATNSAVQKYPGSSNMRVGQIWAHSVGHTGGYYERWVNDHYEDEAPLKQKGAPQVGYWDLGHVWIGGVFDYYLLTGDRRALEVGVLAADSLAEMCPTKYTDHIRWIGWPMHLLLNAYDVTCDPKYLSALDLEWQTLKDNFDADNGWVVMLAFGHCSKEREAERCHGNNMYMLGFTLTALARYHQITQDPEVLNALSVGIDQMIREGWSEEHKSFYLTSCIHQRNSPPQAYNSPTFHASEAFVYESILTGNEEHRRIIREALQSAIRAGQAALISGEPAGQTGYYAGSFHFPPLALPVLDE
ncbi:MAG: hypothetical protein O2955_03240 [Planctomycetota bacterium]|nr:hypothetical protein [Planctomycetota bacterium]MDA1211503.1 hypothetical protein [Planctomycetota bacterium]